MIFLLKNLQINFLIAFSTIFLLEDVIILGFKLHTMVNDTIDKKNHKTSTKNISCCDAKKVFHIQFPEVIPLTIGIKIDTDHKSVSLKKESSQLLS